MLAEGESSIEENMPARLLASEASEGKGLMFKVDIEGAEYETLDVLLKDAWTENVKSPRLRIP